MRRFDLTTDLLVASRQSSPAGRGFRTLLVATALATYVLIIVGAVVRVTGSGLGCPDWPLCHGSILPPPDLATWIEWTHRLTASLVSGLTFLTVIWTVWQYRQDRWIFRPVMLAVVLLVIQIALGGLTVLLELPPTVVAIHLANAMLLFASLLVAGTSAVYGPWPSNRQALAQPARRHLRLIVVTALAVLALIVTGALVVGSGASLACPDWPACNGQLLVTGGNNLVEIHMFHRYVAAAVGILLAWTVYRSWQRRRQAPKLVRPAILLAHLYGAQILVGGVQVWAQLPPLLRGLHLAVAAAIWGTLVVMAVLAYWPSGRQVTGTSQSAGHLQPQPRSEVIGWTTQVTGTSESAGHLQAINRAERRDLVRSYLLLTKPPIVALLLFTTLAAMLIAAKGLPDPATTAWTLLGGALAAGGAGAVNSYIDRDIDQVMRRTKRRPVATGQLQPHQALRFGLALGLLSMVVFTVFVNPLTALLAAFGFGFYTVVYSGYLKRSTPSNIVIGGAAGAIPPLVGWAAVKNGLDLTALYLFAIIFYWTPPHTWALMLMVESDYQRAGVPMLPVIRGEAETRWQIVLYSLLLVAITLVLYVTGAVGTLYLLTAGILGALFVALALSLLQAGSKARARRLYKYSTLYLALLFLALIVDHAF